MRVCHIQEVGLLAFPDCCWPGSCCLSSCVRRLLLAGTPRLRGAACRGVGRGSRSGGCGLAVPRALRLVQWWCRAGATAQLGCRSGVGRGWAWAPAPCSWLPPPSLRTPQGPMEHRVCPGVTGRRPGLRSASLSGACLQTCLVLRLPARWSQWLSPGPPRLQPVQALPYLISVPCLLVASSVLCPAVQAVSLWAQGGWLMRTDPPELSVEPGADQRHSPRWDCAGGGVGRVHLGLVFPSRFLLVSPTCVSHRELGFQAWTGTGQCACRATFLLCKGRLRSLPCPTRHHGCWTVLHRRHHHPCPCPESPRWAVVTAVCAVVQD